MKEAVKDWTPSKTLLTKARLLALLLVVASLLSACGSAGGGQQGHESGEAHNKRTSEKGGGTKEEMDHVAEKNAEHEEVEPLAGNIITTQRAEIEELQSIKQGEFGTSRVPMDMSMGQRKRMGMEMDPQSLADENPFDEAFIDAMIPHHQSAVEMAIVANQESDNPRIKELAANIVSAQEREIAQMQR